MMILRRCRRSGMPFPIVNQCKSFMFGMKALLYVGDFARKVDTAVPYVVMVLKTVPLLAPEYGDAAMKLDESLGSVSMGLKADPYVVNTASSKGTKVDTVLPGGRFGAFENLIKIYGSRKNSKI